MTLQQQLDEANKRLKLQQDIILQNGQIELHKTQNDDLKEHQQHRDSMQRYWVNSDKQNKRQAIYWAGTLFLGFLAILLNAIAQILTA